LFFCILSENSKEIELSARGEIRFAVTDKDNDLSESVTSNHQFKISEKSVNTFVFEI
jgi:hypothetical protein